MRLRLGIVFATSTALGACDSTVVGGGGGLGGAGGGTADPSGTTTATVTTSTSTTTSTTTSSSSSTGAPTPGESGLVIPGDRDRVHILLGNFGQTCDAPREEPPCAAGAWWLATVRLPSSYLVPGRHPLNTGEVSVGLHETFDDCSGEGFAGWDGEPAWLTIDAVDAEHAALTIEGAYAQIDGTWDVPLCSGVTLP